MINSRAIQGLKLKYCTVFRAAMACLGHEMWRFQICGRESRRFRATSPCENLSTLLEGQKTNQSRTVKGLLDRQNPGMFSRNFLFALNKNFIRECQTFYVRFGYWKRHYPATSALSCCCRKNCESKN